VCSKPHISNLRCRFIAKRRTTGGGAGSWVVMFEGGYTPLHYTPLDSTTLQYMTRHYITLNSTPVHATTLHNTHYTTRHALLHYRTRHSTLHYTTLHHYTARSTTTRHDTPLHYNTLFTPRHDLKTLHHTCSNSLRSTLFLSTSTNATNRASRILRV
jgi:hypothetical protein